MPYHMVSRDNAPKCILYMLEYVYGNAENITKVLFKLYVANRNHTDN